MKYKNISKVLLTLALAGCGSAKVLAEDRRCGTAAQKLMATMRLALRSTWETSSNSSKNSTETQ
jgi:hypothetical protein